MIATCFNEEDRLTTCCEIGTVMIDQISLLSHALSGEQCNLREGATSRTRPYDNIVVFCGLVLR